MLSRSIPGGRLLRHDLTIFRNGFLDAFSSLRDRLLLLLVIAAALGWLASTAERLRIAAAAVPLAAIMVYLLFLGAFIHASAGRRLAFLAAESPLAADALAPPARFGFELFWHGLGWLASLPALVLILLGHPELPPVPGLVLSVALPLLGAALGEAGLRGFGQVQRIGGRLPRRRRRSRAIPAGLPRFRRLAILVACRQAIFAGSWRSAAWIGLGAAAAIALAATGAAATLSGPALLLVLAAPILSTMLVFARVDHELVRFACFAGYSAPVTLAAHLVMPSFFALLLLLAVAIPASPALAIAVLAGASWLAAALIASLRILHYRLRSRRMADIVIQIDLVAAAMLGAAFLPLGLAFFVIRSAILASKSARATWMAQ